jgi:hypothetical protein
MCNFFLTVHVEQDLIGELLGRMGYGSLATSSIRPLEIAAYVLHSVAWELPQCEKVIINDIANYATYRKKYI